MQVLNLIDGLNERQIQAVTSTAPIILALAGAGSGKTTVLTKRVANLNLNHGIDTENMLCLTFTRLAGKEMKERVIKLIGQDKGEKLFCNTFHAFAVSVLKEHGWRLGIDENFSIYDQQEREELLKKIIISFGKKTTLKKVIECHENAGDYRDEMSKRPEECRVLMEYGNRCKQNNAVDLNRLIDLVIRLWSIHPDVLNTYRKKYSNVFVDEFQDTNIEQAVMVDMLQASNLFVVGDDFQAIYGWRGAQVKFILDFANANPTCEVIKLEDNYRSTEQIIAAANKLIKNNVNQTDKKLIAHKSGVEVKAYSLLCEEGELYAIRAFISAEEDCSNMAILARTNKFLDKLAYVLNQLEIPYIRANASDDPFELPGVKKVLDWMELLTNTRNDVAVKKCLTHLGISDLAIAELELEALKRGCKLFDVGLTKQVFKTDITDMLIESFSKLKEPSAIELFELVADTINIFEKDKAVKWLEKWSESTENNSAVDFLQYLKYREIKEFFKPEEEKRAVKLMTVHASKGLEFDTVILAGMNQGVFPSARGDIEEERRLAYVATTRAKNKLIMTCSKEISGWGNTTKPAEVSQFINEMGLAIKN